MHHSNQPSFYSDFRWSFGIVMWEICSYGKWITHIYASCVTLIIQDNHPFKILTLNQTGEILCGT